MAIRRQRRRSTGRGPSWRRPASRSGSCRWRSWKPSGRGSEARSTRRSATSATATTSLAVVVTTVASPAGSRRPAGCQTTPTTSLSRRERSWRAAGPTQRRPGDRVACLRGGAGPRPHRRERAAAGGRARRGPRCRAPAPAASGGRAGLRRRASWAGWKARQPSPVAATEPARDTGRWPVVGTISCGGRPSRRRRPRCPGRR